MAIAEIEPINYRNRLKTEHRKLDTKVKILQNNFPLDNTKIKTLKKKKLQLKDLLVRLDA